jgi:lipid-binding SYLF domain-containing protein
MRKHLSFLLAFILLGSVTIGAAGSKEAARLQNCGAVMDDILRIPDDVPSSLVDKAECVIVVPSVMKLAFVVGGSYGRGAMTCRGGEDFSGPWSAPTMIALEGGSLGFQLGGQATDFIILVMNPRGATAILNSKVRIGVNLSAAAGPKGRSAEAATDASFRAELLTYSRSRGLFAGVSLEGSTLRADNGANESLYGQKLDAVDVVRKNVVPAPAAAQNLLSLLTKYSPRNDSDRSSLK